MAYLGEYLRLVAYYWLIEALAVFVLYGYLRTAYVVARYIYQRDWITALDFDA